MFKIDLPGYGFRENPYDKEEHCQCGRVIRPKVCRWCDDEEFVPKEDQNNHH